MAESLQWCRAAWVCSAGWVRFHGKLGIARFFVTLLVVALSPCSLSLCSAVRCGFVAWLVVRLRSLCSELRCAVSSPCSAVSLWFRRLARCRLVVLLLVALFNCSLCGSVASVSLGGLMSPCFVRFYRVLNVAGRGRTRKVLQLTFIILQLTIIILQLSIIILFGPGQVHSCRRPLLHCSVRLFVGPCCIDRFARCSFVLWLRRSLGSPFHRSPGSPFRRSLGSPCSVVRRCSGFDFCLSCFAAAILC
jgi:hypothetical protein